MFTPKKVPFNWYRYDAAYSVELMESFIIGIEEQIKLSIDNFHNNKKVIITEDNPDHDHFEAIEYHLNLDSQTWELDNVFGIHFPNLQRRSALITLFSFFEYELDKLCILYKSHKSLKLDYSDLSGKGVERSASYLELVVNLNVHKDSVSWNNIKNAQKIRNLIVHQDGKLVDFQGNTKKEILEYIKQTPSLSGDDEIIINGGYLQYFLSNIDDYFKLLNRSITVKESI